MDLKRNTKPTPYKPAPYPEFTTHGVDLDVPEGAFRANVVLVKVGYSMIDGTCTFAVLEMTPGVPAPKYDDVVEEEYGGGPEDYDNEDEITDASEGS